MEKGKEVRKGEEDKRYNKSREGRSRAYERGRGKSGEIGKKCMRQKRTREKSGK